MSTGQGKAVKSTGKSSRRVNDEDAGIGKTAFVASAHQRTHQNESSVLSTVDSIGRSVAVSGCRGRESSNCTAE